LVATKSTIALTAPTMATTTSTTMLQLDSFLTVLPVAMPNTQADARILTGSRESVTTAFTMLSKRGTVG
jgi:hypothetical protein